MLLQAKMSEALPERQDIYSSTKALFCLGTPHRGSTYAAWGDIARGLVGILFDSNPTLIKNLKINAGPLIRLQKDFEHLVGGRTFWVYTFTEAKGYKPYPFLKSKASRDTESDPLTHHGLDCQRKLQYDWRPWAGKNFYYKRKPFRHVEVLGDD